MNNVEKIVINWLIETFDNWLIAGEKPKDLPTQYILVDRTGGPREAMVLDRAEILIEVYHKNSRVEASDQANLIADRIHELKSIDNITHTKVNSLIKLDDTVNQYFRYQLYCDIYCRR